MNENAKIETAMTSAEIIAKSDYLRWARSTDISTKARAYELSATAWDRIRPEPSKSEQCGVMADYLLECLATNPPEGNFIHSGVLAGHELSAWLKHLAAIPGAEGVISDVAKRLEFIYKTSDSDTRARVEMGALEHILESPRLRPFFTHWKEDPVLRVGYEPALEWGLAHTEAG